MKKISITLLSIIVLAIIIFFTFAGGIADKKMNKVVPLEGFAVSDKAKSIHENLKVADLHCDLTLWDRNILEEHDHGQVDIPRLVKGNFALQVFNAVIQTPRGMNYQSNTDETDNVTLLAMTNRWPIKSWSSLCERAIHQSNIVKEAAEVSPNLSLVQNQSELQAVLDGRDQGEEVIAAIMSIEGLHALEVKLENLDRLYEAGYRQLGLVHFFDNDIGGSSAGVAKGGLTEFGKEIIRRMEEKKIIIDLAHSSPALIQDVLSIATRPVVVSHTGVKGAHESPRNLLDKEIKQIAALDGLIGIGFWAEAVGGVHPSNVVKSIRYVVDLVGIQYVALGSDFDGAVTTSFDASQMVFLTEALLQEGFSEEDITKIMGGNQIAFFLKNLPE
ncbi:MAG: peptidase M19 [Cytophagales bacterium]|nr:peptidase M19 [Cytophagales bacterium]